jgi:hypothetical protein
LLRMIAANCPKMDALGNDPCGVSRRTLSHTGVDQHESRKAAS